MNAARKTLPFLLVVACINAALPVFAQRATLHARLLDEATGEPTACTVRITDANGKIVTETESFKGGFRCGGEFTKALPPGTTRIRVTRGLETQAEERELQLGAGQTQNVSITLHRNVDLRKLGWYGGDHHVHMLHGERTVPVDFDFVALTARAEDLQFMSLAQAWTVPQATPEALEKELHARSTRDCLLTWNLEAPKNYYQGDAGRCLGHCWNVGTSGRTGDGADVIKMLMEASAWDYESDKPTYANFESHALIHRQGGAVFYSHPARWWTGAWGGKAGYPKRESMRISNMAVELPLDVLIGPTFDGHLKARSAARQFSIQAWAAGNDPRGLDRVEVLRNGQSYQQFTLPPGARYFGTNFSFREPDAAWYCVRAWGGENRKQAATTGAFYFSTRQSRSPKSVPARVKVSLLDADSGQSLAGKVTEVQYEGTAPKPGKIHKIRQSDSEVIMPATARLRADAPGYASQTQSPVIDSPALIQTITTLSDTNLLDWGTYRGIAEQLGRVELVFKLKKQ